MKNDYQCEKHYPGINAACGRCLSALADREQKLLEFARLISRETNSKLEGGFYAKLANILLEEIGEV